MWCDDKELDRFRSEEEQQYRSDPDVALWQYVVSVFGVPFELNAHRLSIRPIATWSVAGAMLLAFWLSFGNMEDAIQRFALFPSDYFRDYGLTVVTSFFLHSGWFHLLGNAYFLLVFGDNVEEVLGVKRFLLLLLLGAVVGTAMHALLDSHPDQPLIGASAGISAIIAFYALSFPRAKVGIFVWFLRFLGYWFRFSVRVAFALWVVQQLVLAYLQGSGASNVSAYAHLGGAACGALLWYLWGERRSV